MYITGPIQEFILTLLKSDTTHTKRGEEKISATIAVVSRRERTYIFTAGHCWSRLLIADNYSILRVLAALS